jgi:hypothetical protein
LPRVGIAGKRNVGGAKGTIKLQQNRIRFLETSHARVRKRDVSFGPRTRDGVTAWDTFMTLAETATKLGVSFYHYMHDRVSGAYQMPSLADLIAEQAKVLNLGTSRDTS